MIRGKAVETFTDQRNGNRTPRNSDVPPAPATLDLAEPVGVRLDRLARRVHNDRGEPSRQRRNPCHIAAGISHETPAPSWMPEAATLPARTLDSLPSPINRGLVIFLE